MKGFMAICRAATCASGVIPECFSRESVVAKRRDSAQKPYGMGIKAKTWCYLALFL
ncbi:hypothetical protein [Candidatus Avelusimicrobium stercoris]|uniref:hypothetical protein n=1 Tax=Candidatus Avelusimicrobium stercoris TaxID=1947924 RepID=UPI003D0FB9ED